MESQLKSITKLNDKQIATFSSSEPLVEQFFHQYALQYDLENVVKTHVRTMNIDLGNDIEEHLVGYFSFFVETFTIPSKRKRKNTLSIPDGYELKTIPALRLHFFGINKELEGLKLGRELLLDAVEQALEIAKRSGCYFITLEACNDNAFYFFKYFGFQYVRKSEGSKSYSIMAIKIEDLMLNNEAGE